MEEVGQNYEIFMEIYFYCESSFYFSGESMVIGSCTSYIPAWQPQLQWRL